MNSVRHVLPGRALAAPVWAVPVLVLLVSAAWVVDPYTLSVLARILSLGLLAVSVAILTGVAGLPTLGQVAPYAVGAYTTALLARAGVTVGPVQLVVAALVAALFSVLVGLAVIQARGITFLMVTLAVGELAAVAAGQWKAVTGGTDGLAGIPAAQPLWGASPLVGDRAVYGYVLVVAVAVTVVTWLALRSPAGLLIRGCRDHEARMRASGHPVTRYLLAVYTAAGAVAGVGGALLVTSQRYVSPQDVGFEVSALVLLAVTIGGATSLGGALAAVAVVVAVREWAAGSIPGHGPLLLGALFVVAVYLLPDGLAGLGARSRHRLDHRPGHRPGEAASS
ncbi:branched-chain amino acid ABC transporter permease [Streptosporangium sp. CA-135522]|uniref:branched-chain amino acid ABC transporter permease n=1 Tax=Streptosporangium sp. CA-135522 TaxID=3240072 RepID=UPI003D8B7758